MLDINYIKENPAEVVERLAAKGKDAAEDVAKILELDKKRRALITETEAIKAEQNKLTKLILNIKRKERIPPRSSRSPERLAQRQRRTMRSSRALRQS